MESWKTIIGYENYEINSSGAVRRRTKSKNGVFDVGFVLKSRLDKYGYLTVALYKDSAKSGKTITVHSLVLLCFLGPRPQGFEINHKDGNKQNNHISNLEYCTSEENRNHAIKMGLTSRGEDHYKAKLNNAIIHEMRRLYYIKKLPVSILHRKFGISKTHFLRCVQGKNWQHLQADKKVEQMRYSVYKSEYRIKGEKHYASKLTVKKVKLIRMLYKPVYGIFAKLGRKFDIHPSTVKRLIKKQAWRHI